MSLPLADKNVIAYDPGDHIGIFGVWEGEPIPGATWDWEDMIQWAAVATKGMMNPFDAIICEEWRLYPHKAQTMIHNDMIGPQVIGMIRVLAYRLGIPIIFQSARDAKHFATDEKLKEVGWWNHLKTKHERDAARHALFYLFKEATK